MSQIKLTVINYDQYDDEVKYRIAVTNDHAVSTLEFYGYSDTFQELACDLLQFPKSIDEIIIFEVGKDDAKWAYHLLLKFFCYEKNGYTAIQIILDNHQSCPETIKTEFYIKTVPSSINNWGRVLANWNPKTEKELMWKADRIDL